VPFKNERLYWAYHSYFGSERFRAAIDNYNAEVRISGLVELAQGKAPEENSAASNVVRAIEDKRPSSALLDSWFHFGVLLGRQHELREANRDQRRFYELGLKSGAPSASVGQRVWYARWMLANAHPLEDRRRDVESVLADLCRDIVLKRRKLPETWIWTQDWFKKLLPDEKKEQSGKPRIKATEKGSSKGQLAARFTRLTISDIRRLAGHKFINDSLLPPLVASDFPPKSNRHP
jgi:hypothetical protein